MTSWLVSDFLLPLNAVPDDSLRVLSQLGELLHSRRNEALVFKKNAGKYVGNYNYRGMANITRRADLVLMAGLDVQRSHALEILDYVQRVLAINEQVGEKSIPPEVKALFPPFPVDDSRQEAIFQEADKLIAQHYGFTDEELDFIINYDVKYRIGRDAEAESV